MARLKQLFSDPLILIWIVVLIILIPILKPGFFSFHDETHMVDVYEMIRSLQLNGFPPRFAPDFNFGLGHPYFNFYYHLPFYVTTVFYHIGLSMTESFKYMLGFSVILAASGFYLFLRNHVSKLAAVFGTLVYLLSPYFAVDLYVRGAPGEMYILALFPWSAYALKKYLNRPDYRNLALSAITIFLISISHNVLLPFIFSLLFLYGLINLMIGKNSLKNSIKIAWPFLTGFLLGAYYLLPAFSEVKFISTYEQFNIADHFPFIKQLIIPHWGYGPSIWGFLDDISFDIGAVNLALLLLSFLIFKFSKREIRILLIFFWTVFALSVVLMNSRTLFFWESMRFLRLVQFPWRMLLFTTISTAFIAALTLEVFSEKFKKFTQAFLLIVLILLLGLNIWHYHPSESKYVTDEKYLELYFANRTLKGNGEKPSLNSEYLNFTEDFIPPTVWQEKRPSNLLDEVKLATGSGVVNFSKSGLSYDIQYQSEHGNKIIVAKTYFPGWNIKSEQHGNLLYSEPYSEYGVIAINVPGGSGNIRLSFENTPVRTAANLISATAALFILVLLIYPRFRRKLK